MGSLWLKGVEDSTIYPARGQIVLVRNEPEMMVVVCGTDDGPDEAVYIMQRAGGGGTVLGGCLQADKWESQPDPNLAVRIMKRCIDICPNLVPHGQGIEALDVVRHGVGLRPMRKQGIRVETEPMQNKRNQAVTIVHNYGHGGYGYQTSYACAALTLDLVLEAVKKNTKSVL